MSDDFNPRFSAEIQRTFDAGVLVGAMVGIAITVAYAMFTMASVTP